MTTFRGIRKLIQLTLSHCTAPQHVGESGNDTGTRKCYKDSSHHTKHNCIQRFSQGQRSISLVLQHLFLSLSKKLELFALPFLEGISKKVLFFSIFAGQNLSRFVHPGNLQSHFVHPGALETHCRGADRCVLWYWE